MDLLLMFFLKTLTNWTIPIARVASAGIKIVIGDLNQSCIEKILWNKNEDLNYPHWCAVVRQSFSILTSIIPSSLYFVPAGFCHSRVRRI